MADNRPIGIFDSGIGGLTVARAIRDVLPKESLIYFGDTAHLPYGDKSTASIRQYSRELTRFLLKQNCKMIVIACNTASAKGFREVERICGGRIPVINVIDPVVEHVTQRYTSGVIGVIGTRGTIGSRVYPRRIHKINPKLKVASRATPLLAPMIEEGFFNQMISTAVIRNYLDYPGLKNMQALILGCTHYPLIREEVASIVGEDVDIINAAHIVAEAVKHALGERQALASRKQADQFWVSDYTESFRASTKIFFEEEIKLNKSRIWEHH